MFQITQAADDLHNLTQVVLQITSMLDMLPAELARVLHFNCGDIAQLFVRFYQGLYARMDGVAMRHGLRVETARLRGVTHSLIVDENRPADFVSHVELDSDWP